MSWTRLVWDDKSTWPPDRTDVLAYAGAWHIGQADRDSFDLDGEWSASRDEPLWWQFLPAAPYE